LSFNKSSYLARVSLIINTIQPQALHVTLQLANTNVNLTVGS